MDERIRRLVDQVEAAVRGGRTLADVRRDLSLWIPEGDLQEAIRAYTSRAEAIRRLRIPSGFVESGESWYLGPRPTDLFWPPLRGILTARLEPSEVEMLDTASTRIVAHLAHPGTDQFSVRGLVLGHVQSGKTSNYSAVITKAVDAGFRLVVVLTGIHELLRSQTQRRLDADVVEASGVEYWHALTTPVSDFRLGSAGRPDAMLAAVSNARVLVVVKKNAGRLRKLVQWLGTASELTLASCPALIIDDEADQASINTAGEDDQSVINGLIVQLLQTLPRSAYVGYTATPFANVLIRPLSVEDQNLYPRSFIFDLPRPAAYFGPERIFGREALPRDAGDAELDGLDVLRTITDSEVPSLRPIGHADYRVFMPTITPSLRRAVLYFWLATAARRARGQLGEHSSMLLHTTMYADVHERFRGPLNAVRDEVAVLLQSDDGGAWSDLESIWEDESARVTIPGLELEPVRFDDLRQQLPWVVSQTQVVVENSRSSARLSYERPGSIQIVVGGNTLSRGLTLEGLVVSYFVRAASAYDTLLQMGRWFGYRPGYGDLPRIWMTDELRQWFTDVATVEREIRYDIERYESEGLTPLDFGPRLRLHPDLSITAAAKMQNAVDADVSFSAQLVQSIIFKRLNLEWLRDNLAAARWLTAQLEHGFESNGAYQIARGVPVDVILEFLTKYTFHDRARALSTELIRAYILAQSATAELLSWNVMLVGRLEARLTIPLTQTVSIGLLERSRLATGDDSDARLGVITSAPDIIADLPAPKPDPHDTIEVARARAGVPLLALYFINKDSQPVREGTRVPLAAVEHVVGVALHFPKAPHDTPQSYRTVDLSAIPREPQFAEDDPDDEQPEP